MSTTGERAIYYCTRRGIFCAGANERGLCNTTACWNDATTVIIKEETEPVKHEEWISCSERLPEDFQRVLVTVVNYKGDKVVRVAEYYNWDSAFQIKENHEWWKVGEKGLLAWMPLPKPYREDGDVDEID